MHATPKMSKKIRDLAKDAYEGDSLRSAYRGRSGSFRSVIVKDGIAIKFAFTEEYAAHNRTEWNAWRKLPESVRRITAKPFCISSCGRVMAVELVPQTLYDEYKKGYRDNYSCDLDEFNDHLKNLLGDSGLFSQEEIRSLMTDNHANNVGVRDNGDLCWIDYAGFAD